VIGTKAFELKEHNYAIEYLNLARKLIESEIDSEALLFNLANSYNATNDYGKALQTIREILKTNPNNEDALRLLKNFEYKRLREFPKSEPDLLHKNGRYSVEKEFDLYARACRGEVIKSHSEIAKLHCSYHATNHFTRIAPFKMEQLDLDYHLVVFHEILSEAEMDYLKEKTKPQIARAKVLQSSAYVVSSARIAQLTWLSDADSVVARISRRVEDMTGLSMQTAEQLQVQNYGIGGNYNLHWDHTIKTQNKSNHVNGNRIATTLFYVTINITTPWFRRN